MSFVILAQLSFYSVHQIQWVCCYLPNVWVLNQSIGYFGIWPQSPGTQPIDAGLHVMRWSNMLLRLPDYTMVCMKWVSYKRIRNNEHISLIHRTLNSTKCHLYATLLFTTASSCLGRQQCIYTYKSYHSCMCECECVCVSCVCVRMLEDINFLMFWTSLDILIALF